MSQSESGTPAEPRSGREDLKQHLDEELSQIVHSYESRGLSPSEIADSVIWHAEVAISRSDEVQTVDQYLEE